MSHFYWEQSETIAAKTSRGPINGLVVDGLHRFLGIPYAAPPVQDRRWRPPSEAAGWKLPRDAFAFGPLAAQNNRSVPGFGYSSNAEDCLYLNVSAPEGADESSRLPVMVWIHGGGLMMGGSDGYDPSALVKTGEIVFVSLNYRINLFGFFSHPSINAEDHEIGNYGIMDQQAALRWVRDNIRGFGGDPDNVTIFGESAGGISVWCHIASPASRGLFDKAIVQSGAAVALARTPSTTDLEGAGQKLLERAGADGHSAQILRAVPTTDLLAANLAPGRPFGHSEYDIGLTCDGVSVPAPLVDLFTSGRFNHVPTINGTMNNEFNWFQAMLELAAGQPLSADAYPEALAAAFRHLPEPLLGSPVPSARIGEVMECYPPSGFLSPSEALAAAITDCGFVSAGNRRINRILRSYESNVFAFELDAPDADMPWPSVSFPYRSAHTKDLQYLFPMFRGGSGRAVPFTEADAKLSSEMIRYWTSFAHHGNPITTGLPAWNSVDPVRDNVMLLAIPECREVERFGERHNCDFWDSFVVPENDPSDTEGERRLIA
jgi:para-nitrobenzyl esterase